MCVCVCVGVTGGGGGDGAPRGGGGGVALSGVACCCLLLPGPAPPQSPMLILPVFTDFALNVVGFDALPHWNHLILKRLLFFSFLVPHFFYTIPFGVRMPKYMLNIAL